MVTNTHIYPSATLMRAAEISSLEGNPSSIGAFNVNFYAQAEGVFYGAFQRGAPYIVQISKGARDFQGGVENILAMIKIAARKFPKNLFSVHLDHGDKAGCFNCVDKGFSSVMIDSSDHPDFDNIRETREVAIHAHKKGISVEAELGRLKGIEEDVVSKRAVYTNPRAVAYFIDQSLCDILAVCYGTSHGPNKGKTDALDIDVLRRCYEALVHFQMNEDYYLCSHGSSMVPEELVRKINTFGGNLKDARGIPLDKMQQIIKYARKINIDTDLRLGITGVVREYLTLHPESANESRTLGLMHRVLFTGELPAKTKKDGTPIEKEQIIDPRDYLWPIVSGEYGVEPDILRRDYREVDDPHFVELMELIKNQVANQVSKLCLVFNTAGLAGSVDKSMTLEEMAKKYSLAT